MTDDIDILKRALKREKMARKQAEKLLEDKSRYLYLSNRELSDSLEALKEIQLQIVQTEKMASVGQLAAGIAHEINNPIGFISSNLETLKEYSESIFSVLTLQQKCIDDFSNNNSLLDELEQLKQKLDLDFILKDLDNLINESVDGTKRVKKIVSDLSEFSHISNQEFEPEDINEILDKTIDLVESKLKHSAVVCKEFSTGLPLVVCNAGKLRQIFLNLLINAAHAISNNFQPNKDSDKSKAEGKITVCTELVEEYIQIDIVDSGCGIEESKLAKIFDPFYTTKEVGKGTGLGLHIVQDVVRKHWGVINVKSEPGYGTCFTIRLPVAGPPDYMPNS